MPSQGLPPCSPDSCRSDCLRCNRTTEPATSGAIRRRHEKRASRCPPPLSRAGEVASVAPPLSLLSQLPCGPRKPKCSRWRRDEVCPTRHRSAIAWASAPAFRLPTQPLPAESVTRTGAERPTTRPCSTCESVLCASLARPSHSLSFHGLCSPPRRYESPPRCQFDWRASRDRSLAQRALECASPSGDRLGSGDIPPALALPDRSLVVAAPKSVRLVASERPSDRNQTA
jgi:hypothetical protein